MLAPALFQTVSQGNVTDVPNENTFKKSNGIGKTSNEFFCLAELFLSSSFLCTSSSRDP